MFKKNILYKSINLEVFKNFLGCLTILFILVASSRLLGYFDKSIAGNLESDLILSILILRSPEFINLLIPLSFFLSVLIALGRLYMDHEIYAYQSAGYSKMAFVKSLLFQTFSLTVISVFLSFYVTPDFEKRADEMLNYSSIEKKLKLLNEDELSHISDERLKLIEKNRATDFEFLNGKIFIDATSPNSLVSSFKKLTTDFNEKDSEEESFERVFNIDELSDKAQFEWALAVPLMIINLMILGVCLTNSAPRQGRMISLLPGLLIFFLYLSTLIVFRDGISENKSFAYFGMWPVHFLVLLTSIFLFVRGDVVSKILFTKTNIAKAVMASILLIILLWLI
jgi:lipopolysaccharide export system permease protein